jgi:hypothetical protein
MWAGVNQAHKYFNQREYYWQLATKFKYGGQGRMQYAPTYINQSEYYGQLTTGN